MSPLDTELREALRHHAADVTSPGAPLDAIERRAHGIRRRRTALAVAGTAVVVAAVAVAVPLITDATSHDDSRAKFAVTSTPTPEVTAPAFPRPVNLLTWPARGQAGSGAGRAFLDTIVADYTARHGAAATGLELWYGRLPTGSEVGVAQVWTAQGGDAWTVVAERLADGRFFVVREAPTWFSDQKAGESVSATKEDVSRIAQISAVVQGEATPYVVVVGAPTTGQILYAADGATFKPVDTVDGVAVFERTGPTGSSPDLIEVLDGNGNLDAPMYKGVIDTGSSVPDK
jgi:hypothetical protein